MRPIIIIAVVGICLCAIFGYMLLGVLYPLRYKNEIIMYATENNLPPELVAGVINAESGFVADKVSKKGAVGLMQLLPTTANYTVQKYGLMTTAPDLFDTEQNIKVGTKYLKYLCDRFGDTQTALFAYNAGEGNVAKWLNEQNTDKLTACPFPETNAYVAKILRTLKWYRFRF
jgi:soluble lytic murein transglycosylase